MGDQCKKIFPQSRNEYHIIYSRNTWPCTILMYCQRPSVHKDVCRKVTGWTGEEIPRLWEIESCAGHDENKVDFSRRKVEYHCQWRGRIQFRKDIGDTSTCRVPVVWVPITHLCSPARRPPHASGVKKRWAARCRPRSPARGQRKVGRLVSHSSPSSPWSCRHLQCSSGQRRCYLQKRLSG